MLRTSPQLIGRVRARRQQEIRHQELQLRQAFFERQQVAANDQKAPLPQIKPAA